MNNSSGGTRKGPEGRVFPLFISLVILGFFVMLLANISVMYFGRSELSAAGFPYFFILLVLIIVPFNISLSILMAVLTFLYIVLFSYLILESRRTGSKRIFRNPSSYVGAFIPFLLLISLVIELLEESLGVKIGGSSITSAFTSAPYTTYLSLIYAPFVEELGFRIIPLGLLIFCEALYISRKSNLRERTSSGRMLAYSFLLPGRLRRNMGIKMGSAEIAGILITSALFGYAHYYFGAWDPGKIAQAAFVGAFLAIGFIEFGPYVDIIMHWFFNGFISIYDVFANVFSELIVVLEFLLLLISGVAFLYYFIEWKSGGIDSSFNGDPVSGD